MTVDESMDGDETLGIMDEIQCLVSDTLQVVSYKWLSRKFCKSSNNAKRLLQDFVKKHGSNLEVIYTVSGWAKDNPQAYHIRLVRDSRLSDAIQEFSDHSLVQVYSIQACIPKDPAVLWSAEFSQTEELFDQHYSINNCLRDNRFCEISNFFVKRHHGEKSDTVSPVISKNASGIHAPTKLNSVLQNAQLQLHKQKFPTQSSPAATLDGKIDFSAPEINVHSTKSIILNEKSLPTSGGSLTNIWDRASEKVKLSTLSTSSTDDFIKCASASSTHTSIPVVSDTVNGADDKCDINNQRKANRQNDLKRKAIFNFSDDEDSEKNIINLESCKSPNKIIIDFSHSDECPIMAKELFRSKENKPSKVGTKPIEIENRSESLEKGVLVDGTINERSELEMKDKKNNNMKNEPFTLTKRKKVLNTRIDERGREVTEVVWEEPAVFSNSNKETFDNSTKTWHPSMKKVGSDTSVPTSNAISSKAGNKKTKGGVKDAKQGNILSFFKKI